MNTKEIITNIANTYRATAELKFTSGCPTLFNDTAVSTDITNYCKELLGSDMAFSKSDLYKKSEFHATAAKSTGSEDFSYITHKVPSVMLALAAGNAETGCSYPLHHPKTMFDENSLAYGAAIYAYNAMRWLENHS